MAKQRTEEWFKAREGRFTSSRIVELLTDGSRPMTAEELTKYKEDNPKGKKKTIKCIGDSLYTYAKEKAVEKMFGRDREESFTSSDMQRGITLEPVAFEIFRELKGMEFIEVKEAEFFPYGSDSGSSPDGLVGNDAVLEIKCPRPNKFFNLVTNGEKAIDKVYIAQMQHQMMCTNSKRCHFFNYIVYNNEPMYHEIVIERDEVMISLMKDRIETAVYTRDAHIEDLKTFYEGLANNGL